MASGASVVVCQVLVRPWRVFIDGASNARRFGVEIMMMSPEGLRLEKSLRLGFQVYNNEVEYEVLVTSLRAVQNLGAKEVEVFSNSKLVVSQIEGSFEAKDSCMAQYLKLFRTLRACF